MKDYYSNTSQIIDMYNQTVNKIKNSNFETTESEDEFLQNFCIHFAHALIKDTGFGGKSREELEKICEIILDVIR